MRTRTLRHSKILPTLRIGRVTLDVPLLAILLLGELLVIGALLLFYRINYKPDVQTFLISWPGRVFVVFLTGCAVLAIGTFARVRRLLCGHSQVVRQTVLFNIGPALAMLLVFETTLRLLSIETLAPGPAIGNTLLRPRLWNEIVERYTPMVAEIERIEPYFVEDSQLGWTVGASRRSSDGLLLSSVEGIRSPAAGMAVIDQSATCRVALVGDSFVLGEETTFESSWGNQLQSLLPPGCQVLNFGVTAYGIDQMYLRYDRDVKPWRPNVVILGLTHGAPERTLGVYGFLIVTDANWPWAKPRFILHSGELVQVNRPLISSSQIYAFPSIRQVPFIQYDRWFGPEEWEQPNWESFYASYVFRFLTTCYPLYGISRAEVSDEALASINLAFFKRFAQDVSAQGTVPLVLYLPKKDDYLEKPEKLRSLQLLRTGGVRHMDLTGCLRSLPMENLFVRGRDGGHYTPAGNKLVAACLHSEVARALTHSVRKSMNKG